MREINIRVAVGSLSKKGCKFYKTDDNLEAIDISKANDLGNKTWGYISYFVMKAGYVLIGKRDYEVNLKRQYGVAAESKSQKQQKNVVRETTDKRKPSLDDFINDDKSSEFLHLLELNHMVTKFDNSVFKKTKAEKIDFKNTIHLFKISKDTVPFNDQKIWSSRYEKFEQIPVNK